MNNTPWIKWYSGDFLNGVADLSPHEIALYTVILCRIYDEDKAIPHDLKKLARRCNMRMPQCEKALNSLLSEGKLTSDGTFIDNERAQDEREKRQKTSAKQSVNASKGWQDGARKPNKNNGSGKPPHSQDDAKPMPTRTRSQNQIEKKYIKKEPIDFEEINNWATEKGLNIDTSETAYDEYWEHLSANGKHPVDDYQHGFKFWLLNAQRFSGEQPHPPKTPEQIDAEEKAAQAKRQLTIKSEIKESLLRAERFGFNREEMLAGVAERNGVTLERVKELAA